MANLLEMRSFSLLVIVLFSFGLPKAQIYSTGNEPASIKWKQIETEHFRVVFPAHFQSKGKVLAGYLEETYKCGGNSLNHLPKKISVIVHSNSTVANGLVTWAPKRMELYSTNGQDSYAQDWLQQLALHEFRHVVQIDKLNVGFTKFLSYLFGELGTGAVLGLYLPNWFMEGDAVATETALSQSGRGRMPSFTQGLKAQVLEKEIYSYEKAALGSYKDYIPNRYEFGYQIVAHARNRYGNGVWEKAVDRSGRKGYSLNPFLYGIREITGLNKRHLYQTVMDSLSQVWSVEQSLLYADNEKFVVDDTLTFKNYLYPQPHGNSVVALVESPDFLSRFVQIDSLGVEKTLFEVGNNVDEPFHLLNNKLVWSEYQPSLRYEHRNYSVVKEYDFKTHKTITLTHKTRFSAPSINPIFQTILCVDNADDGSQSLVILDGNTGNILKRYSVEANEEIISPIWIDNGENIVAILINNSGKRLAMFDVRANEWHNLIEPSYTNISNLSAVNNSIIFTSLNSNQDNIFSINRQSGNISQLTHSKYGSTFGTFTSNSNFLFSAYTSNGYRIVKIDSLSLGSSVTQLGFSSDVATALSRNEIRQPLFTPSDTLYEVKKYSRFHLLNIYGWGPFTQDGVSVYPGFSLMSQNLLGNTVMGIGYNADSNFSSEKFYFNIAYSGWFPKLNLTVNYGDRAIKYNYWKALTVDESEVANVVADDVQSITTIKPGVSLPFNLSRGLYSASIEPSASLIYQNYGQINEQQGFYSRDSQGKYYSTSSIAVTQSNYDYISARYGLFSYIIKQSSSRDVWTRRGATFEAYYQQSPWSNVSRGSLFSVKGDLYFRGFFKHDAFRCSVSFEDKNPVYDGDSRVAYSNIFSVCRGFDNILSDQITTFKTDYQIPILCPDAVVSGALYLKRIRLNLFADYSFYSRLNITTSVISKYDATSVGSDFWADVHFFQWSVPFAVGYRIGYKPASDVNFYQFLWSVHF